MDINIATDQYLAYRSASNLRLSTLKEYRRVVRKYIETIKIKDTDNITYVTILDYINSLREDSRLANSTIHTVRSILVSYVGYLNLYGITDLRDVHKRIPQVKLDHTRPIYMSPEILEQFLNAVELSNRCKGVTRLRNIAMVHLLVDTGMRESEIVRLKISDVDLHNRLVTVSNECKGRKQRIVPFTQNTANKIRQYLAARKCSESLFMFVTGKGRYPAQTYVYKMIIRYANRAGLQGIHPHTFRHTAATNWLAKGLSINAVKTLLGHASVVTTMIYTHDEEDQSIKEYREKLG